MPESTKKPEASDDNLKLHELYDRRGNKAAKGKQSLALLHTVFQTSVSQQTSSHEKGMPMMKLKHRWMRNRNLVAGVTTVSFNDKGEALVSEIGNARLDCEQLCRQYPGLIEFVEPAIEEPVAAPVVEEPVKKAPEAPVVPEAPQEAAAPMEAPEEPSASEKPKTAAEPPFRAAYRATSGDKSESQMKDPPKKKAPPKKHKR